MIYYIHVQGNGFFSYLLYHVRYRCVLQERIIIGTYVQDNTYDLSDFLKDCYDLIGDILVYASRVKLYPIPLSQKKIDLGTDWFSMLCTDNFNFVFTLHNYYEKCNHDRKTKYETYLNSLEKNV